ncbi:MAG: cytochrome c oxidase assembly protein [Rickettsiales bacterium]
MNKNTKIAGSLVMLVAGMTMLSFAAVPLYRIFCSVTGYGGTTKEATKLPDKVYDRVIKIEFNADIDQKLNWRFKPGERFHNVRVGEQALTFFVAQNLENTSSKGRAIYNVVPFKAGSYFNKIECFCFSEQTLEPNQKVNMPVSFFIDPEILNDPDMDDVNTITLSYSFFPAKD